MNTEQVIPCPVCQTPIPISPRALLAGAQFVCPQCSAVIGLHQDSKPIVKDSLDKLEEAKKEILKRKKPN